MGQGKGKVSFWSFKVKPGAIIIEITGLDKERSFRVLKLASYKLPVKAKPVDKKYSLDEES
jgi:ribosomal protein L16/L10AE